MFAEKLIHKELKNYRTTETRKDRNREFFKMPLKKAIAVVNSVADEIGENNKSEEKQKTSLESYLKKTGQTGVCKSPAKTLPANTHITYGSHHYQHKQYPGIVVAKKINKNYPIDDQGEPVSSERHLAENGIHSKEHVTAELKNEASINPERIDVIYNNLFRDDQMLERDKRESIGFWPWFIFIIGILLICAYINFR